MWELAAPAERKSLMSGLPADDDLPRVDTRVRIDPIRVDLSQAEARLERRKGFGHLVHYVEFDLCAEVEAQCRPVADEVRALTADGVLLRDMQDASGTRVDPHHDVEVIAKAVHSLRLAVAKILAGTSARDRVAAAVRDPAHATAPEVSVEDLKSGAWVDCLVRHVAPLSADLAAVVAAAPSGVPSAADLAISQALSTSDRPGLDHAVRALERRFPELRYRRARLVEGRVVMAGAVQRREQERIDRELRELRLS